MGHLFSGCGPSFDEFVFYFTVHRYIKIAIDNSLWHRYAITLSRIRRNFPNYNLLMDRYFLITRLHSEKIHDSVTMYKYL